MTSVLGNIESERYIMDKEKILSQNKKENLYLDE